MTFLTLSKNGVIAAFFLGVLLLLFGGFKPIFVLFMLYFLVLSAIVTALGKKYKKRIKVYEKSRGVWNVLSNGLGPLIFTVLFFITLYLSNWQATMLLIVGFGASVASITADKFSSEIGVLNGRPRDIFTFKRLKRGRSGGITALGLSAGLLGATIISFSFAYFSLIGMPFMPLGFSYIPILAVSVSVGGFVGTIVDSVAGHFEEKKIGNKFTSNFICSICGGVAGLLIFVLLSAL